MRLGPRSRRRVMHGRLLCTSFSRLPAISREERDALALSEEEFRAQLAREQEAAEEFARLRR